MSERHDNAYAQSKLALTMWTNALAEELGESGPVIVSVNPGSLLGTKMVREAFGTLGPPHPDARDPAKCRALMRALDAILAAAA